ncbi:MAG: extracellular solute-binding protein [Acetobacteraceae bacterium]
MLRHLLHPKPHTALAAVVALALGCAAPAARATTLVLYAAQHEQTVDQVVKAFTKETGIDVKVRTGEPPELASELLKEGASSPADVFFTANSPELTLLSENGRLAKVDPATLARVPPQYNSPTGDWIGVLARVNVLVFNTSKIKASALPASLLDLAKPEWKGKLAVAPTDADFLPLVAAVVAEKGRPAALAWLKGLRRNAMIFDDNEGVAAAVERGAAAVGIANNYYLPRLAVEKGADKMHSTMYYFGHGDVGALVNISGAGILKSSRRQAEAQKFLAFLVSTPVQQMLAKADVTFEYPLVAGVAANPALKPFDELQPPKLSIQQLSDDRDSAKLLREAGLI